MIRHEWRRLSLGDCVELASGGTPSMSEPQYWGGDLPWVSCKDMKVDRIDDSEDHVTEIGAANGTRAVPAGTILIVVRGMILAREFPVAVTNRQVTFNQDLKAIRCRGPASSEYLYYWLKGNTPLILGTVDEAAHGTKRLQTDRLLGLRLNCPPQAYQDRVVAVLRSYDDLIENNAKRIKILEATARSLYREWFMNFRFPGHEKTKFANSKLGKIPEAWNVAKLGDVYDTSSGGTPSRKNPEYFAPPGEGIPWVKTKELGDGWIWETEEDITQEGLDNSSAKLFETDTVILAMYGATIGQTGILAQPATTNQACCAIIPSSEATPFRSAFIWCYLLENREKIVGLGMGAAQPNISQIVVRRLEILLPDEQLAGGFDQHVWPLLLTIQNLQRKNQNLRVTRDLLLPRLISGEIDVSSLPLEPAAS